MNDDKELELIKARKLRELRKKLAEKPVESNPDRDLVISRLYDRGIEVLTLAENKYPNQINSILKEIANLLRTNSISGNISGNAESVTDGVYTTSSVTALNDVSTAGSGKIITNMLKSLIYL